MTNNNPEQTPQNNEQNVTETEARGYGNSVITYPLENYPTIVWGSILFVLTAFVGMVVYEFQGMKSTIDSLVTTSQENRLNDQKDLQNKFDSINSTLSTLSSDNDVDEQILRLQKDKIVPIKGQVDLHDIKFEKLSNNIDAKIDGIDSKIEDVKKSIDLAIREKTNLTENTLKELRNELKILFEKINDTEKNIIRMQTKVDAVAGNFDVSSAIVVSIIPVDKFVDTNFAESKSDDLSEFFKGFNGGFVGFTEILENAKKKEIAYFVKVTIVSGESGEAYTRILGDQKGLFGIFKYIDRVIQRITKFSGAQVSTFSNMNLTARKYGLSGQIPIYVSGYSLVLHSKSQSANIDYYEITSDKSLVDIKTYDPEKDHILSISKFSSTTATSGLERQRETFDTWFTLLLFLDRKWNSFGFPVKMYYDLESGRVIYNPPNKNPLLLFPKVKP